MNEPMKDQEQNLGPPVMPTRPAPHLTETTQSTAEAAGTTAEQPKTEQAKSKMQDFASKTSEKVGEARQQVGERMSALANQGRQGTEALGEAATSVAERLGGAGSYLQEVSFDEMVHDLATVVRRYPLQSVLIGVGVGYLLARSMER